MIHGLFTLSCLLLISLMCGVSYEGSVCVWGGVGVLLG